MTLNLFTAGLYHSVEQQMSAMFLHDGEPVSRWAKDTFEQWAKAGLGLDVTSGDGWSQIGELRLIANVVKHAEGDSEHKLRALRPDVFEHPLMRHPAYADIPASQLPVRVPLAGQDLYPIKADFDSYTASITAFWQWLDRST